MTSIWNILHYDYQVLFVPCQQKGTQIIQLFCDLQVQGGILNPVASQTLKNSHRMLLDIEI